MQTHHRRFLELSNHLVQAQSFWRPSPFTQTKLEWQLTHPDLFNACLNLTDEQVVELDSSPEIAFNFLRSFLPNLTELNRLTQLNTLVSQDYKYPSFLTNGIPGRKLQQLVKFTNAVTPTTDHLIDWCCGKAHLGRLMVQRYQIACTGFEHNELLIQQGQHLSKKQLKDSGWSKLALVKKDVLNQPSQLNHSHHALALHACGDLHRTLIEQVIEHKVQALALSPCCYSLWINNDFIPLSQLAKASCLQLTRDDLKLAVQETVTSSPRETQQIMKLNAYRLGFDCLQRTIRQVDDYLPIPSMPKSITHNGFEEFCHHVARIKQISIPDNVVFEPFEQLGFVRFKQVQRLQIVRQAYRRAIETWLVLDLALRLEESSYLVTIDEFCDRELTPRNILLQAKAF